MKRIILAVIILFAFGTVIFAQQVSGTSNRPTSAQTKENATQFLSHGRSTSSDFEVILADLNARNKANDETLYFNRLKEDIVKLEETIMSEENKISASLERGLRISQTTLDRIQSMIEQHKAKLAELEAFTRAN